MYALRIKAFVSMHNSHNEKTKYMMRLCIESERSHRRIRTAEENNAEANGDAFRFLNWDIQPAQHIRKGTDTITILALRAAIHFEASVKVIDDKACLIKEAGSQNEEPIIDPKSIIRTLMRKKREQALQDLLDRPYVGHSFKNIKGCKVANKIISDYKTEMNDNIQSFIIKARCNMLITGSIALQNHDHHDHNANMDHIPSCPYCHTVERDSLAHRLNRCHSNLVQKKKRHNMIQNVIANDMREKYGASHVTTDMGIVIDSEHVDAPYSSLKPDLVAWDDREIHIIEFSSPYDMQRENGADTLTETYEAKREKYAGLKQHCITKFNRQVTLHIIIVSSLGAIHKETIKDVKKLYTGWLNQKRKVAKVLRKMSTAALVGSYFIFYGIPFNENNRHGDDHHTIEGTNTDEHEEPDSQPSHSESSEDANNSSGSSTNPSVPTSADGTDVEEEVEEEAEDEDEDEEGPGSIDEILTMNQEDIHSSGDDNDELQDDEDEEEEYENEDGDELSGRHQEAETSTAAGEAAQVPSQDGTSH